MHSDGDRFNHAASDRNLDLISCSPIFSSDAAELTGDVAFENKRQGSGTMPSRFPHFAKAIFPHAMTGLLDEHLSRTNFYRLKRAIDFSYEENHDRVTWTGKAILGLDDITRSIFLFYRHKLNRQQRRTFRIAVDKQLRLEDDNILENRKCSL